MQITKLHAIRVFVFLRADFLWLNKGFLKEEHSSFVKAKFIFSNCSFTNRLLIQNCLTKLNAVHIPLEAPTNTNLFNFIAVLGPEWLSRVVTMLKAERPTEARESHSFENS